MELERGLGGGPDVAWEQKGANQDELYAIRNWMVPLQENVAVVVVVVAVVVGRRPLEDVGTYSRIFGVGNQRNIADLGE